MTVAHASLPCPICRQPSQSKYRPFCSARCAKIDLGRWFNETYRVPVEQETPESNEGGDDSPPSKADRLDNSR